MSSESPQSNANSAATQAETRKSTQKKARLAFIGNMQADGHTSVAFGADVMPRLQWAKWLAMAMAQVGVITPEQADGVCDILGTDLGNSSQLGMALVKEEVLKRQDAQNAAKSLAEILKERAAQVPAAPVAAS